MCPTVCSIPGENLAFDGVIQGSQDRKLPEPDNNTSQGLLFMPSSAPAAFVGVRA